MMELLLCPLEGLAALEVREVECLTNLMKRIN